MRQLRQLTQLLDSIPLWAQIAIAVLLVFYTCISVYGRINVDFGVKVFSRIPKDQIRSDKWHIVQYTVIPAFVTVGYFALLLTTYLTSPFIVE